MANAEGVNPGRHEVERQLDRMLAHPLFQARKLQADIFAFLVEGFLAGKEVNELALFVEFYSVEEFKDRSTKVRANVNYMRALIQEYYDGPGLDDPVVIAVPVPKRSSKRKKNFKLVKRPPGEAYKPEFTYNPRHKVAQDFALANHLSIGTPSQIEQSIWRYDAILKLEPDNPEAVLGMVEALACQLMQGIYPDESTRAALIASSLELIARLEPASADNWRSHILRGVLHMCSNNLDAARKEFDIALKLDHQGTVNRGWYLHFLFVSGQQEEALRLLGLEAAESFDDPAVLAAYGMFLWKANRFEEAEGALRHALGLDRNYWPAHWGLVRLCLSTERPKAAHAHAQFLETLLQREDYEFLMRQVNLNPDNA